MTRRAGMFGVGLVALTTSVSLGSQARTPELVIEAADSMSRARPASPRF